MPQYCCVPGCTKSGGNQFPVEKDLNLKWRVAIKRTDPVTRGLWKPGRYDVVCLAHFKDNDFRVCGLLGPMDPGEKICRQCSRTEIRTSIT